jgi:4-hydroxy-L-threonine phosphate dehydrogenase PdxA
LIIGTLLVAASVGQGTAFKMAGEGSVDPGPTMEAFELAAQVWPFKMIICQASQRGHQC